jgi:hypothetical protein
MRPVLSNMTRVRPSRRTPPALTNSSFVVEGDTVMTLIPSPFPEGLTESTVVEASTNWILAASDQRRNALRAAPITSLPALIFEGGELSEVEREMRIGLVVHLICADELLYW